MRASVAILVCFFNLACSVSFVDVKKPENIAAYLERIEVHNQRIKQVNASIDIKAHGVLASFLHEIADVVIQPPQFMFWSLRSFFGTPTLIMASNGEYVTGYDFSGNTHEPYQKIALSNDSFFEVMDFGLHPASLIYLLAQQIPLEKMRDLQLGTKDKKLSVRAILDGDWQLFAVLDLETDQLLQYELKNEQKKMSYQARYLNYHDVNGIDFPASLVLLAKGRERSAKLQIEFLHTELNGHLVLPDVFYVRPH